MSKRNVVIATPSHDWKIDIRFADSLVRTMMECPKKDIYILPIFSPDDALVQRARNRLVRMFLSGDAGDIVFIDADQMWEPEWVMALLEHPVDVVGAPVRRKKIEEDYNVKSRDGVLSFDEELGLFMPESVGTGFLRVSRKALQAAWDASEPYDDNGTACRMVFDVRVVGGKLYSEDTMFCLKLREAGFPVYLDPKFTVPHIGEHIYMGDFQAYVAAPSVEARQRATKP